MGPRSASGVDIPRQSQSSDEVITDQSDDEIEQTAIKRLRRQTRRVERLSRRVHSRVAREAAGPTDGDTLGRRFVAILENSVLFLILVLFVLIAAQVVLEQTSAAGLSIRQHRVLCLGRSDDLLGLPVSSLR